MRVAITLAAFAICSAGANQWTRIGPEGGFVPRLAADPHAPSTVYAGTCGGVFKTVDGGGNWAPVNSVLDFQGCVNLIAVDPDGTVYLGGNCRIFKSSDGGVSWASVDIPDNCTLSIAVTTRPGTVYAGSGGVFKTTDGGVHWSRMSSGLAFGDAIGNLAVDPQNTDTVYAAGVAGVYKTVDGGASWTASASGLPTHIDALAIDRQAVYAGSGSKIFKSANGAVTWTDASRGLPIADPSISVSVVKALSAGTLLTAIFDRHSSSGESFILATSTDGGTSWTVATDSTLAANDLSAILQDPQDSATLYIGTRQGVLKSSDGGAHWHYANSGLRATPVRQVVVDSQNGTLYAVNGDDTPHHGTTVFKSPDNGKTWTAADRGLPSSIAILAADPRDARILFTFGNGGLFKTEDAGETWNQIWMVPTAITAVPLAVDPQNSNILYAGFTRCIGTCDPRIAKSTDGGHTWTELETSLALKGCCSSVALVTVAPEDPNTIYAGTADLDGTGSGLWKSADAGATWMNLRGGNILSISIDPKNATAVYYSVNGYLYKSTDGGADSTLSNSGLAECCFAKFIAIDPEDSHTLYYAGLEHKSTKEDVFRSTDGGATWNSVSVGLLGRIDSLAVDAAHPRTVYAGTTAGLFTTTFPVPKRTPGVRR